MDEKFVSPCPPPSPYEAELLTILIEECMEVAQRATKMLRFGVNEVQPGQDLDNAERLSVEVGDLLAVIRLCTEADLISHSVSQHAVAAKLNKLRIYMQTTKDQQ